jgi:hypothetical protein
MGALAEALDVSKSGFYAHRRKPQRPRRQHDAQLAPLLAESFTRSRRTYGSPRVLSDLRAAGERWGKNRVARLMRAQGLAHARNGAFVRGPPTAAHEHPIAENWLAQVPAPDRPGRVWQGLAELHRDRGRLALPRLHPRRLHPRIAAASMPPQTLRGSSPPAASP